jgi:hypothetical protein
MNAVREKIKEYLALLQVEKLILNYHVHTLTYVVGSKIVWQFHE